MLAIAGEMVIPWVHPRPRKGPVMRAVYITVPLAALALLGAACSGPGRQQSDDANPPVTQTLTSAPDDTSQPPVTVTETAPPSSPTTTGATPPPAECSTDVTNSDFGPAISRGVVQLGELGAQPWEVTPLADWFYHFQVKEDGYDPCRELSYVAVEGSNGDAAGSAGTGASINDALVLFHYGDVINNPAPFQMKTVEQVTRQSDSELQVTYGHAGGATAEGVTETYTLNFFIDRGLSAWGDLPESIDSHLRLFLG